MIKIVHFTGSMPLGYLEAKMAHHIQFLLEDGLKIFSPCTGVSVEITGTNTFSVQDGDMSGTGEFLTQKWGLVWYGPQGMSCTIHDTPAQAIKDKSEMAAHFTVSHIQEVWV